MRILRLFLFAIALSVVFVGSLQAEGLPPGFERISGRYIDVITDMPLDDDLRELPQVFDAAVPVWCEVFGLQIADVASWHTEAFVMLQRQRFEEAGFLPASISGFAYGFQMGDRLWLAEQPSAYYRRHLLLHEGTHWFMSRKYGRQGPPWLMEGMAEWLGTHRWEGKRLTMGIIPEAKEEVPYWGRITLIQQQLSKGTAPSLETVLRYGDTAHQQIDAYAWSWAAVIFLKGEPDTAQVFQALLERPMEAADSTNRWLYRQLSVQWPWLRQRWNALLTELEYGYDPTRGMLSFSRDAKPLQGVEQVTIRADRSWQPSGILVRAGMRIQLQAEGEFSLGEQPKSWKSFPEGVTLEYYRGQPLGRLLMAVAAPIAEEPDFSQPLWTLPVGSEGEFTVEKSGELQFRVNETSRGLSNNSGTIMLTLQP